MRCRYCGGRVYCYRTVYANFGKNPVRYRKCEKCRRTFKTAEVELTGLVSGALEVIGKRFDII